MNKPIYLLTEQTESENGKKSTYTRSAYEDKCRAFDRINEIVNCDDNQDVRWAFSPERTHSGEIRIIGKGPVVIFRDEEGSEPEPAVITLTMEEIRLVVRKEDVMSK